PDRHVYHSVFSKNNSRRIGALNCGKDVLDVYECGAIPSPARKRDHSSIARSVSTLVHGRLVVCEVDQLVLAEARVQREVHQTSESLLLHLRYAGDWIGIEHAIADDTQASGPLCNKYSAIRKERHTPRLVEALRHNETNLMLDAGIENNGSLRQRRRWPDN